MNPYLDPNMTPKRNQKNVTPTFYIDTKCFLSWRKIRENGLYNVPFSKPTSKEYYICNLSMHNCSKLLYKMECFVDVSAINKIDNLTCMIIHDNLTCTIIMKRIRVLILLWFLWDNRAIFLYNKQNNTWMFGNMKLFLVLNRISHSFALFTREISWSTLEINFIFPHIRVLQPRTHVPRSYLRSPPRPHARSPRVSVSGDKILGTRLAMY